MIHNEKRIVIVLSLALFIALAIIAAMLSQRVAYSGTMGATNMPNVPGPVAMPTSPDGMLHSLFGNVTAVNGNSLTVSATMPGKISPSQVTVTPASDATITLQVPKDPKVYMQEVDAYNKKQSASVTSSTTASTPPTPTPPPLPFTTKTISLSDITAGMAITITPVASTKQDATNITAQSIVTIEMPKMPAVAQPVPTPTSPAAPAVK